MKKLIKIFCTAVMCAAICLSCGCSNNAKNKATSDTVNTTPRQTTAPSEGLPAEKIHYILSTEGEYGDINADTKPIGVSDVKVFNVKEQHYTNDYSKSEKYESDTLYLECKIHKNSNEIESSDVGVHFDLYDENNQLIGSVNLFTDPNVKLENGEQVKDETPGIQEGEVGLCAYHLLTPDSGSIIENMSDEDIEKCTLKITEIKEQIRFQ